MHLGGARGSDSPRGPCRRSAPDPPVPPRRWRRRWPGAIHLHLSSVPAGIPATTSSRMRWGSSVRGLSEVTTTASARRAAMAAICGPLGAVPVAAAAEHADQAAVGEGAAGRQGILQPIRGVGVVHQHRGQGSSRRVRPPAPSDPAPPGSWPGPPAAGAGAGPAAAGPPPPPAGSSG